MPDEVLVRAFSEPLSRRRNWSRRKVEGRGARTGMRRRGGCAIHVLILEGSFCPVHAGHLQLVDVAKRHLEDMAAHKRGSGVDGDVDGDTDDGELEGEETLVVAFLVASPDASLKRKMRRKQDCDQLEGNEDDDVCVPGHHRNAMLELAVEDADLSSWVFVAPVFELAAASSEARQPTWDDVAPLARRATMEAVMANGQQSGGAVDGSPPTVHVHKVMGADAASRILCLRRRRQRRQRQRGDDSRSGSRNVLDDNSRSNDDLLCILNREMDDGEEGAGVMAEVYRDLRDDQIIVMPSTDALNLSSTKIRKHLRMASAADRSLVESNALGPSVLQYIRRHSLFASPFGHDVIKDDDYGTLLTARNRDHKITSAVAATPGASAADSTAMSRVKSSDDEVSEEGVICHLSKLSSLPLLANVLWDGNDADTNDRKPIGLGMSSSVFAYKGSFATSAITPAGPGVCIKIFRNHRQWVLKSFLAETTVFEKLWNSNEDPPHSSIVRCLGAGLTCGSRPNRQFFLILERIPGGSIWSHLSSWPHPQIANVNWHRCGEGAAAAPASTATKTPIRTWKHFPPDKGWARAVADFVDAVAHLHRHGILHGDLTVANVLYDNHDDQNPRLVLSDFGCALETNHNIPSPPYKPFEVFHQRIETKTKKKLSKKQEKSLERQGTSSTSTLDSAYDELSEVYSLALLVIELARRVPLWPVGARIHKNQHNLQSVRQGRFPGPKLTEVAKGQDDDSARWNANVRAMPVAATSSSSASWAKSEWKAEWAELLYPCAQVERSSRRTAAQLATALSLLVQDFEKGL